jgi:hypothetical protein
MWLTLAQHAGLTLQNAVIRTQKLLGMVLEMMPDTDSCHGIACLLEQG